MSSISEKLLNSSSTTVAESWKQSGGVVEGESFSHSSKSSAKSGMNFLPVGGGVSIMLIPSESESERRR